MKCNSGNGSPFHSCLRKTWIDFESMRELNLQFPSNMKLKPERCRNGQQLDQKRNSVVNKRN
jgi:hypothetical protein